MSPKSRETCGGRRVTLGHILIFTGRTGRQEIITRSYKLFSFLGSPYVRWPSVLYTPGVKR